MNTAKKFTKKQQIQRFIDFIFHDKITASTILWEKEKPKNAWQVINPSNSLADHAAQLAEKNDIYYCPNQFFSWRLDKNLHKMTVMYVDVDCHEEIEGLDTLERCDIILRKLAETENKLESKGIPKPSAIVYTGRGFHLYWRINTQKGFAAKKYQTTLRELAKICDGDMRCCDTTRMLRLPYTYNTKTASLVNVEYVHYYIYDFSELCDAVLPLTKEELEDIRAVRAKKGLPLSHDKATQSTIYNRWYLVHQDLLKITDFHCTNKGVLEGSRDTLLFHLINSLSWFIHSDALQGEIVSMVNRFFPTFTVKQALSYCSSITRRAKKSVAGDEFRYKYKRQTLFDELEHLIPPSLASSLKAIASNTEMQHRKQAKRAESNKAKGVMNRKDYQERAQQRFKDVVTLVQKNLPYSIIAEKLDISISLVKSNVAKAKKKGILIKKLSLSAIKNQVVKVRSLYSLRSKGFLSILMSSFAVPPTFLAAMLFYPLKNIKKIGMPAGIPSSYYLKSSGGGCIRVITYHTHKNLTY